MVGFFYTDIMRIIFMDHDGVVCLPLQFGTRFKKPNKYDADLFDPGAIKVINEILIAVPDTEIVISSDWRHHFSLGKMREMYSWQGIIKQPLSFTVGLSGVATDLENLRVKEITHWINTHNHDGNWVALDDMDLSVLGEDHFVQCGIGGIKQQNLREKVIKLLTK